MTYLPRLYYPRIKIHKPLKDRIKTAIPCCIFCFSTLNLAIEHIDPVTNGGTNHLSNLTVLCQRCNSSKGNYSIEKFYFSIWRKRNNVYEETVSFLDQIRTGKYKHHVYNKLYLLKRIRVNKAQHTHFTRILQSLINDHHIKFTAENLLA